MEDFEELDEILGSLGSGSPKNSVQSKPAPDFDHLLESLSIMAEEPVKTQALEVEPSKVSVRSNWSVTSSAKDTPSQSNDKTFIFKFEEEEQKKKEEKRRKEEEYWYKNNEKQRMEQEKQAAKANFENLISHKVGTIQKDKPSPQKDSISESAANIQQLYQASLLAQKKNGRGIKENPRSLNPQFSKYFHNYKISSSI